MRVTDVVPQKIIDHNTLVEGVKAEVTILPALGFAADIMGVEAAEFDYGGSVLRWWEDEGGGCGAGCCADRARHCKYMGGATCISRDYVLQSS